MIRIFLLLLVLSTIQCSTPTKEKAEDWIAKANLAHGTKRLEKNGFRFRFRKHIYGYQKNKNELLYSRTLYQDQGDTITDTLKNHREFQRWVNRTPIQLNDSISHVFSESINSVLYFVQIPKVLNDPAVKSTLLGETVIDKETYISLKVTFSQAQGGADYQDEYRYWINKKTHLIDYLAYRFYTDQGGTRFRKAFNRRTINGLVFQDYYNFKPQEKFSPLDRLPQLLEHEKLIQVSVIETKDVVFL